MTVQMYKIAAEIRPIRPTRYEVYLNETGYRRFDSAFDTLEQAKTYVEDTLNRHREEREFRQKNPSIFYRGEA